MGSVLSAKRDPSPEVSESDGSVIRTDMNNLQYDILEGKKEGEHINLLAPTVIKTGDYTITEEDVAILADTGSGGFTLTLPASATLGIKRKVIIIKKITAANSLTITGNDSETIDGSGGLILTKNNECLVLVSDGINWRIVSHYSTDFSFIRQVTSWDWEDNFESDNWIDADSAKIGVNVTHQQLEASIVLDSTNDASYIDSLGGILSDVAFVARWDVKQGVLVFNGTTGNYTLLGLTSSIANSLAAQDGLFFQHRVVGSPLQNQYYAGVSNNTNLLTTSTQLSGWVPAENDIRGLELIRLSATSAKYSIYPDLNYNVPVGTNTETISSGITNLRYNKIANRSNRNGNNVNNLSITGTRIENGVTTPP